jgi:tryptophan synthase alpha chain
MSDRLSAAFADGNGKRAALMPYLMGGYPSIEESVACGLAAADAGADLLELGIPFSDPLADGPVIHAAGTDALAAGATPHAVLGVCERLAERVPVVLMVYANIVFTAGASAFALRAAAAGASGLIVPDLPHDEAGELREACDAEGLALVPLVAPTTTTERIAEIGADARGFIYTVSLTGTTGERAELPPDLTGTVERVRAATGVPVAVGFGISTPEQARSVGEVADGVIVGTRVVRAAGEGGAGAVGSLVAELRAAL